VTFPPDHDPTSQPGGAPGSMGNQPYGTPGQQYPPPGQQYPPPGQPYTGQGYTGQPYTGTPGQPYTGQPYTGTPGQPYEQPSQPYGGMPGTPPGLSYQPGQPVGVPPFQGTGPSNMANIARNRGIRQIVIGAIIFVVGLIITIATYSAASSSRTGGTYFVAYGPMIIGVVSIVRGLIAVSQASRLR
jgi:hypothetical protein